MSGKCIVVTSGKGGVGKTTSTANIGSALAMYGPKVVLIDTDIGLRNLDLLIGLENRILYDLTHVIEGKCPVRKALIKHKKLENLSFLPASMSRDKEEIQPEQVKAIVVLQESIRDLRSPWRAPTRRWLSQLQRCLPSGTQTGWLPSSRDQEYPNPDWL